MTEPVKWKLVPVEPTPEMIAAFWRQKNTGTQELGSWGDETSDYDAYRAMISASPAEALPSQTSGAVRELPFGFEGPFSVKVDKDDEVHLCDANGRVETYNTHTQLPLDRKDLLDEERDEWKAWAEFIASALNAALAKPASEPAGGGVREAALLGFEHGYGCARDSSKHYVSKEFIEKRRAAMLAALSSPASSSPAEAEALQDGVDSLLVHLNGCLSREDDDGMVNVPAWYIKASIRALSSAPAQEDGS